MIQVQDSAVLEELASLVGAEGLEVLGLASGSANCLKDFCTRACAVGRLIIGQDRLSVRCNLQRLVGKQRRHAQLGVARQHSEDSLKVGIEAILLAKAGAQLFGDLVPQGVGDDDYSLFVLAYELLDVVAVEGSL